MKKISHGNQRVSPTYNIEAVLFDADGVLQNASSSWFSALEGLVGDPSRTEEFLSDLFEAERPCVAGHADFARELAIVLERWGSDCTVEEALQLWTMIEPDAEALEIVRSVRKSGLSVGLASNQQAYRANYMLTVLGYEKIFDHLFVSCEMRVAKPSREYFTEIVSRMGLSASSILFIDDREPNVHAAKLTGLNAEVYNEEKGTPTLKAILGAYGVHIT